MSYSTFFLKINDFLSFFNVYKNMNIKNILDILIVALLFYKMYFFIRNTKAEQLLRGFVIILILMKVSELLGFITMHWILQNTLTYGLIAFLILFQPEFRKALTHLGKSKFWSKNADKNDILFIVKELSDAVYKLSESKTGALITIERNISLGEYVKKGTAIDSVLSSSILQNIFIVNTPLHDGAIIIQDGRISAANCVYPLTERALPVEYGTRHRAAIGISENTDSVTIVVSEETGKISLSINGKLKRIKTEKEFSTLLSKILNDDFQKNTKRKITKCIK